ncbi:MAG: ParA family protein [Actinomycetota bacterium]
MSVSAPAAHDWKLLENRPFLPGRGRVICIANQKGGVGKTTTAVNLAAGLAARGRRILVIDLDPQANATTGLGLDHRSVETSTYDVLVGELPVTEATTTTAWPGLECLPASLDLAGAEIELVSALARERRLAEILATLGDRYDIVFVDCPPSLGLLTVNALAAAQDLIVPVQCEYYALEGLGQLLETAERIRRSLNPDLRIAGFVLTMYDARTKLSSQVADEVRRHFGALVYDTVIPRSVRLSEAPSFGEPVLSLDPSSRGSISYKLLAAELDRRYGLQDMASSLAPPPPSSNEGSSAPAAEPTEVVRGRPGPDGRGFGTSAPEPPGLEQAWPRPAPWSSS